MYSITWLNPNRLEFPHPSEANDAGILAAGGDLSPERLLYAYSQGIFPWFNPGDPIIWWSPDPRFVLFPKDLRVSKSMRPYFNQKKYRVTLDQVFPQVIEACSEVERRGQGGGTWITDDMKAAYTELHQLGYAHSVEVWEAEQLVGGLYGIAIGRIFFGESMFSKRSNASKFGFIALTRKLIEQGYQLIDCQQETQHLTSLGGSNIPREEFLDMLQKNDFDATQRGNWGDFFSL